MIICSINSKSQYTIPINIAQARISRDGGVLSESYISPQDGRTLQGKFAGCSWLARRLYKWQPPCPDHLG